jgi:hypothetical protein
VVALLLAGCSSGDAVVVDGGGPGADLGSQDQGSPAGAGDDAADAPSARGGTGGTVRGGVGGTNRGGSGGGGKTGAGGAAIDASSSPDTSSPSAPSNDTCQTPLAIKLDRPRVDLVATTLGATHDLDLGCGNGGVDVFFSFTLTERELVYADSFGSGFDTILSFTEACGGADAGAPTGSEPSCVDDACGSKQSQVVALLPPGKHYLVVSGAGGESGDVSLHFEHAPVGSGLVAPLGLGSSATFGATSGAGRLSLCEAGGPENSYWFTSCGVFTGGPFMASTCSGTAYDTMLALQIPRAAVVVCNDDACKLQASITTSLPPGAGLHVLSVDGFTAHQLGAYSLTTTRP